MHLKLKVNEKKLISNRQIVNKTVDICRNKEVVGNFWPAVCICTTFTCEQSNSHCVTFLIILLNDA